jgi:hypothetical protein
MNKSFFTSTILLLLMSANTFAQDLKVTFSQEQHTDKSASIYNVGQIGDNVYVVASDAKGKMSITTFDKLLKIQQEAIVRDKNGAENGILDSELTYDETLTEYDLAINHRNITGVTYHFDNKAGEILCAGFYSDIKTSAARTGDIDGFFYSKINPETQKIIMQEIKAFPPTLVNQLAGKDTDKKVKEGKGISPTFSIRDFFRKEDGSMLISSESNWSVTVCNKYSCSTTYYSYNILLIDIDKDGNVKSFYDIPKRQSSGLRYYLSNAAMQKDNEFAFAFFDNPINMKKAIENVKDVSKMTNPNKAALSFVSLTSKGKIVRNNVTLNKKDKMLAIPRKCIKIGEGQYVIPREGKNKYGLIKVEL